MRTLFAAAVVAALSMSPVVAAAQTPPDQSGPNNAAIKSPDKNNAGAPVKGANSFTRGEAISRLKARGYSHVSHLQKDNNGVWHGMAQKDGRPASVSVDFQGNVIGS
jgi:opacity protein-like surface antigen